MNVEEIKLAIAALSAEEQRHLSGSLVSLRIASDPESRALIQSRMDDQDPSHWLTLEEFERRLDQN